MGVLGWGWGSGGGGGIKYQRRVTRVGSILLNARDTEEGGGGEGWDGSTDPVDRRRSSYGCSARRGCNTTVSGPCQGYGSSSHPGRRSSHCTPGGKRGEWRNRDTGRETQGSNKK